MKAVIFAAGIGKRLRPHTLDKPKQLVMISGKTIIEHVWDALPDAVLEVILVVGYKQEMIRDFLGENYKGKKVTYVVQEVPLGTADAMFLCKTHVENEEKFLLMYADDLHGRESIEKCLEYEMALLVSVVDDPSKYGVVVMNDDGTIKEIEEKPEKPKTNLAATGVYVLSPKIFNYTTTDKKNGELYVTDMIEKLLHDHQIQAVHSSFWIPIGYPEDIGFAEEILRGKRII